MKTPLNDWQVAQVLKHGTDQQFYTQGYVSGVEGQKPIPFEYTRDSILWWKGFIAGQLVRIDHIKADH